ncbi:MAG: M20/M25/M40 family metallo-hydrolase [Candidatus Micrarchaeota archaeon]|nr:M20/M25/M40 family metallo-hydrolase [Candidatus Micrarchaeota archaeon]
MAEDSEALSLLRKLISINSVFPRERRLAEFCASYLQQCGFSVRLEEFAPNRFNVIAQKGKRKGSLLLSAHLDTVPPCDYGRRNPFRMRTAGDRILGLGCFDMKAGLALVLLCAKYCRPAKRGIRIVLTADEENISEGTWAAQRAGHYRHCSLAICHEIPDAPGWKARGNGRPPIILGRRGRTVFHFRIRGKAAHGAVELGVNAIDLSIRLGRALGRVPIPKSTFGRCRLFIRKLASDSSFLSVPVDAVLELDAHYAPPHTPESLLAHIRKHLRGLKLPQGSSWSVCIPKRKTPYLAPYRTDFRNPQVRKFLSLYRLHFGKPSLSWGMTVADENILALEMPVITIGPKGGGAHSAEEWVSKSDFLLLAGKMPLLLQKMLE